MKKILTSLDLNCNEIQNFVVQKLATDPSSPGVSGRIYYNTTDNVLKIHNGTSWEEVKGGSAEITRLIVSKGGTGLTDIPAGHLIMGSNDDHCSTVEVASHMDSSTSDGESSIPTSGAVVGYVTDKVKEAISNATLRYKGVILADGTITSDDAELNSKKINQLVSYESGWIFKIAEDITNPVTTFGADYEVSAGDVIMTIANSFTFSSDIFVIMNRNIEDSATVNCVTTPTGGSLAKFASNGKIIESSTISETSINDAITKSHTVTESTSPVVVTKSDSNEVSVTLENVASGNFEVGQYGPSDEIEITSDTSFKVPQITVDTYGRITDISNITVKITFPKSIKSFSSTNEELTVGSNGITGWQVAHNLDNINPIVQVYEDNRLIICDVSIVTKDSVAITITDPSKADSTISAGTYKVVVMG